MVQHLLTDSYAKSLEHRIDATLFERGALVQEPAAAAALVRAALAAPDRCRAEAVVGAAERLAAARPEYPCLAVAAEHARGALDRDAPRLMQASADYTDSWSKASAAEDAAVVLVERGDSCTAMCWLERARNAYEVVRAEHDLDRVRARMRELGVRVRHWSYAERPTFGWDSLTDTERRVVDLVVEGLTNRQIAQRLFLSPHTVAFHLRQVFRKLTVNCRVQLTRIVMDHAAEETSEVSRQRHNARDRRTRTA